MVDTIKVVTPDDMGNTLVLGSDNKYNVDVSQLDLPDNITAFNLEGRTLKITTNKGTHQTDLSALVPEQTVDLSLKSISREGEKAVFIVGEKGTTDKDTQLEFDVPDLLPVQVTNPLQGDGTANSPLSLKVSVYTGDNLIKLENDGIYVSPADIQTLIPATPSRPIRLVNATGQTQIGFIYDTEQ